MNRHELTDAAWRQLAPLLPPQRPVVGRPNRDHRTIINAMLWLTKTGAPRRDLPERYRPWRTVATRFYRWTRIGLWQRILAELQRDGDAAGRLDWSVHRHRCKNRRGAARGDGFLSSEAADVGVQVAAVHR